MYFVDADTAALMTSINEKLNPVDAAKVTKIENAKDAIWYQIKLAINRKEYDTVIFDINKEAYPAILSILKGYGYKTSGGSRMLKVSWKKDQV